MEMYDRLSDIEFRAKLIENPKLYAEELGYSINEETEVKVVKNSKDTFYIVFAPVASGDIDLEQIQAAATAGTAGTTTTMGSVSSCFSSFGTLGTAGSAS